MSAARLILLSLLLAALTARASDYPLVDPLPEGGAGSGGIGRATQSLYRGEGVRFDYLPVNLVFGERAYVHADRIGIKKDVDSTLRLDIFLAHRYEGTPLDGIPAVLAGMAIREQGSAKVPVAGPISSREPWGSCAISRSEAVTPAP